MKQLPDDCPITALKLDAPVMNCLIRLDVETVGQLCQNSAEGLLNELKFSPKVIDHIVHRLTENGRALGDCTQ